MGTGENVRCYVVVDALHTKHTDDLVWLRDISQQRIEILTLSKHSQTLITFLIIFLLVPFFHPNTHPSSLLAVERDDLPSLLTYALLFLIIT